MNENTYRFRQNLMLTISAVCLGYSIYLNIRVSSLERRINQHPIAMQLLNSLSAQRNPRIELDLPRNKEFVTPAVPPRLEIPLIQPDIEQRLDRIEKQMKPHIELLSAQKSMTPISE